MGSDLYTVLLKRNTGPARSANQLLAAEARVVEGVVEGLGHQPWRGSFLLARQKNNQEGTGADRH